LTRHAGFPEEWRYYKPPSAIQHYDTLT